MADGAISVSFLQGEFGEAYFPGHRSQLAMIVSGARVLPVEIIKKEFKYIRKLEQTVFDRGRVI